MLWNFSIIGLGSCIGCSFHTHKLSYKEMIIIYFTIPIFCMILFYSAKIFPITYSNFTHY